MADTVINKALIQVAFDTKQLNAQIVQIKKQVSNIKATIDTSRLLGNTVPKLTVKLDSVQLRNDIIAVINSVKTPLTLPVTTTGGGGGARLPTADLQTARLLAREVAELNDKYQSGKITAKNYADQIEALSGRMRGLATSTQLTTSQQTNLFNQATRNTQAITRQKTSTQELLRVYTRLGAVTAVTVAALAAIRAGYNAMSDAALKAVEKQKVLNKLVTDADFGKVSSELQELGVKIGGAIPVDVLQRNFVLLRQAGQETGDILAFFEASAAIAADKGLDMAEALDRATKAAILNKDELNENAGILVDVSAKNDAYAKSIGTTTDKLTSQQKAYAQIVGVIEEAETSGASGRLAANFNTLIESSSKLKQAGADFKVAFGTATTDFVIALNTALTTVLGTVTNLLNQYSRLTGATSDSQEISFVSTTLAETSNGSLTPEEQLRKLKSLKGTDILELNISFAGIEEALAATETALKNGATNLGAVFASALLKEYKGVVKDDVGLAALAIPISDIRAKTSVGGTFASGLIDDIEDAINGGRAIEIDEKFINAPVLRTSGLLDSILAYNTAIDSILSNNTEVTTSVEATGDSVAKLVQILIDNSKELDNLPPENLVDTTGDTGFVDTTPTATALDNLRTEYESLVELINRKKVEGLQLITDKDVDDLAAFEGRVAALQSQGLVGDSENVSGFIKDIRTLSGELTALKDITKNGFNATNYLNNIVGDTVDVVDLIRVSNTLRDINAERDRLSAVKNNAEFSNDFATASSAGTRIEALNLSITELETALEALGASVPLSDVLLPTDLDTAPIEELEQAIKDIDGVKKTLESVGGTDSLVSQLNNEQEVLQARIDVLKELAQVEEDRVQAAQELADKEAAISSTNLDNMRKQVELEQELLKAAIESDTKRQETNIKGNLDNQQASIRLQEQFNNEVTKSNELNNIGRVKSEELLNTLTEFGKLGISLDLSKLIKDTEATKGEITSLEDAISKVDLTFVDQNAFANAIESILEFRKGLSDLANFVPEIVLPSVVVPVGVGNEIAKTLDEQIAATELEPPTELVVKFSEAFNDLLANTTIKTGADLEALKGGLSDLILVLTDVGADESVIAKLQAQLEGLNKFIPTVSRSISGLLTALTFGDAGIGTINSLVKDAIATNDVVFLEALMQVSLDNESLNAARLLAQEALANDPLVTKLQLQLDGIDKLGQTTSSPATVDEATDNLATLDVLKQQAANILANSGLTAAQAEAARQLIDGLDELAGENNTFLDKSAESSLQFAKTIVDAATQAATSLIEGIKKGDVGSIFSGLGGAANAFGFLSPVLGIFGGILGFLGGLFAAPKEDKTEKEAAKRREAINARKVGDGASTVNINITVNQDIDIQTNTLSNPQVSGEFRKLARESTQEYINTLNRSNLLGSKKR